MATRMTTTLAAARNATILAFAVALAAVAATPAEAQDPPPTEEQQQQTQDLQQQMQEIERIVTRMQEARDRADSLETQFGDELAQRDTDPDDPDEPMRPEDTDEPQRTIHDERMREMARDIEMAAEGVHRMAQRIQDVMRDPSLMGQQEADVDDPAVERETTGDSEMESQIGQLVDHLDETASGIEETLELLERMQEQGRSP